MNFAWERWRHDIMCRRAYDSLKSLSLGQNYFLSLQIDTKKKKVLPWLDSSVG